MAVLDVCVIPPGEGGRDVVGHGRDCLDREVASNDAIGDSHALWIRSLVAGHPEVDRHRPPWEARTLRRGEPGDTGNVAAAERALALRDPRHRRDRQPGA